MKAGKLFLKLMLAIVVLYCGFYFLNSTKAASDDNATLSTDVQAYILLEITAGSTVNFGDLTPLDPIVAPATGTIASVTTTAANGYNLSIGDGSDTNSSMRHTDLTTYIPDFTGTITTPSAWIDGVSVGVGVTLYAADNNKEAKWGTGTAYNDVNNLYAGIPAASTVAHTVTGYHASADTSSWAFKLDVPNNQKTGSYSGDIIFTATGVL